MLTCSIMYSPCVLWLYVICVMSPVHARMVLCACVLLFRLVLSPLSQPISSSPAKFCTNTSNFNPPPRSHSTSNDVSHHHDKPTMDGSLSRIMESQSRRMQQGGEDGRADVPLHGRVYDLSFSCCGDMCTYHRLVSYANMSSHHAYACRCVLW